MYDANNLPEGLSTYRIRSTVRAVKVESDVLVSTPFGAIPASAGDYIVVTEDGKIAPVPAAEFERTFIPEDSNEAYWEPHNDADPEPDTEPESDES